MSLGPGEAAGRRARGHPALITGGAGFIGTNLADRLLCQGRHVIIFDSLTRPGAERNLRWLLHRHRSRLHVEIADLRETARLHDAVAGAGTVFHLAAQVAVTTSLDDPARDFAVNAAGTLELLEALRRGCVKRLIFTSTNKIYGAIDDIDLVQRGSRYVPVGGIGRTGIDEHRTLRFHSPYGCSKGAADQYVLDYARSYGLAAAVFRMSCIYGPHQHGTEDQGWLAHFMIRAMQGRAITIYGDGKQVRDVLYVNDLIDAFVLAEQRLDELAGEAFNIGGGPENTLSLLELIAQIAALQGEEPAVEFGPWRVGDQRWYVSDFGKFSDATGWRPQVGVANGIRRLHEWLSCSEIVPATMQAVP